MGMSSTDKILIIGGSGQIGTELTPELRSRFGHENVIRADLKEPSDHLKDNELFEQIDVQDQQTLERIVKKHGITQIYNLAAVLSAKAEKQPRKAWEINMNGFFNVADVSLKYEVEKVFWPSSIAVFGRRSPKDNTPQYTITDPSTIYGISKLAGERWSKYYFRNYSLDIRSLRYPGLISNQAEPGGGTTDYAVDIFYKALAGEPFRCFLSRDAQLPMMYMPDAIRATIELMNAEPDSVSLHDAYNITALSFTPAELADEIRKHIPDFKIEYEPDYRQKIADSWPNNIDDSVARRDWGWYPEIGLADLVEDMLINIQKKIAT